MHELSLCESIVELVVESATRERMARISRVSVEIGAGAAVDAEALRFCFPVAAEGAVAASAELAIVEVSLAARCNSCGAEFKPDTLFDPCPACGGAGRTIRSGREMSHSAARDRRPREAAADSLFRSGSRGGGSLAPRADKTQTEKAERERRPGRGLRNRQRQAAAAEIIGGAAVHRHADAVNSRRVGTEIRDGVESEPGVVASRGRDIKQETT